MTIQQQTAWDVGLSENARIFIAEEMKVAQVTGSLLAPEHMRLPLEDLIDMARAALVALTGWPVSAFQTAGDCEHLRGHLPAATGSPLYSDAVAGALNACLYILNEIDGFLANGDDPQLLDDLLRELLPELVEKLQRADGIARERWGPERIANQLRPSAARGDKMLEYARAGHAAVYGTPEEKASRWKKYRDDYSDSLLRLGKKDAAKLDAAGKNNVTTRTIERALRRK